NHPHPHKNMRHNKQPPHPNSPPIPKQPPHLPRRSPQRRRRRRKMSKHSHPKIVNAPTSPHTSSNPRAPTKKSNPLKTNPNKKTKIPRAQPQTNSESLPVCVSLWPRPPHPPKM